MSLAPGQYAIDGFVYGAGANNIWVQSTSIDPGTATLQDSAQVGQDGVQFGVDTLPGLVVTQTGVINCPGQSYQALDIYEELASIWNNPAIRLANNAVSVLQLCYPSSPSTRRCYGRGRQILPTLGFVKQGVVQFTAAFQAADNSFYDDDLSLMPLSQLPADNGGMTPPITPPVTLAPNTQQQNDIAVNAGKLPTWPIFTWQGPIANPGVVLVDSDLKLLWNNVLASGEQLIIDTQPWARTSLLDSGASAAGDLTGDRIVDMMLAPGATKIRQVGQDITGTSYLQVAWRSAYAAIGGSIAA